MKIPLKEAFNFENAIKSHGWWMLSPNHWDNEKQKYYRPVKLNSGKNILLSVTYADDHLMIDIENNVFLNVVEMKEIEKLVSWIFRLEEDFESFYSMSAEHEELLHLSSERKGRLLRSPTLFEDVIKVILTTNTRWQQTINMVNHLVDGLGDPVATKNQIEFKAFPRPEKILEAGEDYLKEHVRVGYRSTYIMDAAFKTLDPSFNLESYKNINQEIDDLKKIKGIGPYAFSTLSMLLGRYDSLPVDSEYKKLVINKYFDGEMPTKKELEGVYDKWKNYKFLAYWFDH